MADPLDSLVEQAEARLQAEVTAGKREETLTDKWRAAAAPTTDVLAEGIGRFFQTMSQTGSVKGVAGFKEPAQPMQRAVGQGIASTVIPQTPTQAALMGAQFIPGMQALPLAGRIALPTIAGAGASRLSGESGLSGAFQGALAALPSFPTRRSSDLPAALRSRLATRGLERKVAEDFMPRFGEAVAKDVPALAPVAPRSGESSVLIQDPSVGLKALQRGMDSTDEAIKVVFGREPVQVPTLAGMGFKEAIEQKMGGPVSEAVYFQLQSQIPKTMPAAEVLSELRLLKAAARRAPKGIQGYAERALARRAESEFVSAIAAKDPQVARQYVQMVQDFDKGLDVIRVMEQIGLGLDPTGAMVRPEAVRTFLIENVAEYPPGRFPNIWKAAFPKELGAGDVLTKLGGERAYLPLPGAARVSAPVGRVPLVQRVERGRIPQPVTLPRIGGLAGAALGAEVTE